MGFRQTQAIVGSKCSCLQSLDWQIGITQRGCGIGAGGRSEMQDVVQGFINLDEPRNILLYQSEVWVTLKMLKICTVAGYKIVETDHPVTFSQQTVSQMRAQKTSSASK